VFCALCQVQETEILRILTDFNPNIWRQWTKHKTLPLIDKQKEAAKKGHLKHSEKFEYSREKILCYKRIITTQCYYRFRFSNFLRPRIYIFYINDSLAILDKQKKSGGHL
jgi:hypothetical protein